MSICYHHNIRTPLCVICGEAHSCSYFNGDYKIININDKECFFCDECVSEIFNEYRLIQTISWENIIFGANHSETIKSFSAWIKLIIKCGYIIPKAERASMMIQRTFRKYINRKKNLRKYYLIANRLLKTKNLPYLPPEMYMMISKFI